MKLKDLKQGESIKKRLFAEFVLLKLKEKGYNIEFNHIISIVNILFEEMIKKLFKNKKFIIGGFGNFIFKKMPPRNYFNFQTNKVEKSIGNKLLRFKLEDNLRLKLTNNLDVNKTFNEEINEKNE